MAMHSSVLAGRIPWTEKPVGYSIKKTNESILLSVSGFSFHFISTFRRMDRYNGREKCALRDVPGGPLVRHPSFHCRGHRFDPCSGD